ncbi:FAD-binding oxidoreductase [Candidatus Woesearchaeota archaeon]|nr:FAD-binding oxidoreductase [Candidatus Woesearchaeota archaeon]
MGDVDSAITEWRRILGRDGVLDHGSSLDVLLENCGGMERQIIAVVFPRGTADVIRIVNAANKYLVPLYPISRGKNYGLGSRLPVKDGCAVVSLEKMNSVVEVNLNHGYAVIEPGVTQHQLYKYLRDSGTPYFLDTTGSGRDTSILGNILDGGDTYYSRRDLRDLEVVLGNGSLIKTGLSHYGNALAGHLSSVGVGPNLSGLFRQSNFGIVTKAAVGLLPVGEDHAIMVCNVDNDSLLPQLINKLSSLRREAVLRSSVHISNRDRIEIYIKPMAYKYAADFLHKNDESETLDFAEYVFRKGGFGAWSAVTGIFGTKPEVYAVKKEIKRVLHGIGKLKFIKKSTLDFLEVIPLDYVKALAYAMKPLYEITRGVPTDVALYTVHWPLGHFPNNELLDPDKCKKCGLLYYLPIIPTDGDTANMVVWKIKDIFSDNKFTPYITLNMVTQDTLEGVVNLSFDRSDKDQALRARNCIDKTMRELADKGVYPCRVDIDSMDKVLVDDSFWRLVQNLKKICDPNGIIAPGRYNFI